MNFNKLMTLLLLVITPMICYSQKADTMNVFHGYEGELIFVFRDSCDTALTSEKKIMLDTLANQMKNWPYKGFFITKLYCYNNGKKKEKSDLRAKNIISYLKEVHNIKHNYFIVEHVNMKDESFLYSRLEHIRIFKKYDKSLINPYR